MQLICNVIPCQEALHVYTHIILFTYFWLRWVFLAALGLLFAVAHQLLTAVASLVMEHGL